MSVRGIPAPPVYAPHLYWEERAVRFAAEREGLAAVCSYGMPEFYNRAIHLEQHLALSPWVRVKPGTRVLDLGCGVGRWSRLLASRGAIVTGVDLSPTMIAQARRRAEAEGLADRCRFEVQDLAELAVQGPFDLILGVTVLQHILDPALLRRAIAAVRALLAPDGRVVLLEVAPNATVNRCDTTIFKARPRATYLELFRDSDLELRAVTGVDPASFRTWLLPHLRRLPRHVSAALLAAVTVLSVPVNLLVGRTAVADSWHAVFVLGAGTGRDRHGH